MAELFKEEEKKIDTSFKDEKEGLSEGYKKTEAVDLSYLDSPEYEYLKQSGEIGWLKFKDWKNLVGLDEIHRHVSDNTVESWKENVEASKKAVKDARIKRDQFAIEHPEDITVGSKLLGGVVESITNPIELGANIGAGVATGGASLLTKVAVQESIDIGQLILEKERYDEEAPSVKEIAFTSAVSALPDVAGSLIGSTARNKIKGKQIIKDIKGSKLFQMKVNKDSVGDSISNIAHDVGGEKINVKSPQEQIIEIDNLGNNPQATQQAWKTEYGVNVENGKDPYISVGKDISPKKYDAQPKDTVLGDPYGIVGELTSDAYRNKFKKATGIDIPKDIKINDMASVFIKNRIKNIQLNKDSSVLSRYVDTVEVMMNPSNKMFKTIKSPIEQYINPEKTPLQNIAIIQDNTQIHKKLGNKFAVAIDEYYGRVKKEGRHFKAGFNVEYPRRIINNLDSEFQTQVINIQNEYRQMLGMKFQNFIGNIGSKENNMAKAWIQGSNSEDFVNFGKNYGCTKFVNSAYKDSVLLDSFRMKANLTDSKFYKEISKKYGSSFDEYGDIRYNGEIFKNLTKAKKNIEHTEMIYDLLENNNPEQYVKFITNAKRYLDGGISKEEKNEIIKFFDVDKGYLTRRTRELADEINTRFDKLSTEELTSNNKNNWIKKSIKNIESKKNKLAQESVKINQCVNKNSLIRKFQSYFDGDLDLHQDAWKNVGLRKDIDFEKEIMPFYKNVDGGNPVFKLEKGQTPVEHFKEFVASIKSTTKNHRYSDDRISVGELRRFFNDDKMSDFFINVNEGSHLKQNWEIMNDIVHKNSEESARFLKFGSTSPNALKNKLTDKLEEYIKGDLRKQTGPETKALNSILEEMNQYLENIHIKTPSTARSTQSRVHRAFQTGVRFGIMGLTGPAEIIGSNQAIALMRAQKYGGFNPYLNALRAGNNGDLIFPKGKYIVAQAVKDTDFSKFGDNTFNTVDRFAMSIQSFSDSQMRNLGEAHTVALLDNLPEKYNGLENELKEVFSTNGIDESNYHVFKEFTSNHIEKNQNIIDVNKLYRNIEIGTDNKMSEALKNSYYRISQDIGDIRYNAKFMPKTKDEILQWYTMFRGFTRMLNADLATRVFSFTDSDGISKSKLSKAYINRDDAWKYMAKDTGLGLTGLGAIVFANQANIVGKEFTQSKHTFDQRVAIVKAHGTHIYNTICKSDGFIDWAMGVAELGSITPKDVFQATDMLPSLFTKLKRVYDTFTDEEKKAYGTNVEEGLQQFALFIAQTFISRVGTNLGTATYNYATQGDIVSMPKKIYGLSKEESQKAFADVTQEQLKEQLDDDSKFYTSMVDYLHNRNDSYDEMPDNYYKQELEKQIKDKDENTKNHAKQIYAVNFSNGSIGYTEAGKRLNIETNGMIDIKPLEKDDVKPFKKHNIAHKDGWKAPKKINLNRFIAPSQPSVQEDVSDWKAPKKIDINKFFMPIKIKQQDVEDIVKKDIK